MEEVKKLGKYLVFICTVCMLSMYELLNKQLVSLNYGVFFISSLSICVCMCVCEFLSACDKGINEKRWIKNSPIQCIKNKNKKSCNMFTGIFIA